MYLPAEIIERINVVVKFLNDDHRAQQADQVAAIFDLCEQAFANEFDRGYELAQEEVGEWYDPDPPDRN